MGAPDGGTYANRCGTCNGAQPRWYLLRMGDAAVSWACDHHLVGELERLQRPERPHPTEVVVRMRGEEYSAELARRRALEGGGVRSDDNRDQPGLRHRLEAAVAAGDSLPSIDVATLTAVHVDCRELDRIYLERSPGLAAELAEVLEPPGITLLAGPRRRPGPAQSSQQGVAR